MKDEIEEDEDEKMKMLTRKFHRFMNRKRGERRNFQKMKEELGQREGGEHSKKGPFTCYECKKLSHIRNECSQLEKKKKLSKKVMKATWNCKLSGSSDDNDNSNKEVVNVCLMV